MIMVDPFVAVFLSFILIVFMLALGIPVFVTLGLTGFIGCGLISNWHQALLTLKTFPYVQMASYTLIVVPLFVIMGHFAFKAGIGRDVFNMARLWLSRFPAGLGIATIVGSGGFAACSGSSVATAATMGAVAVPEMVENGYDPGLACGIVAAGGVLGIMIPPSIVLVIYGSLTDTSVGLLLLAGVIPGLLSIVIFSIGLVLLSIFRPELSCTAMHYSWKERLVSLKFCLWASILFIIVIGGIYIGWFTPTEASAVGAFVALCALFVRRNVLGGETLRKVLIECFAQTVKTTSMMFIVFLGAGFYSFFLTLAQVPEMISIYFATLAFPPLVIVFFFLAILIILGMFLDSISLLLVTMPVMFPVVTSELGYSPIWFGVLATQACEIGLITPPVGLNAYILAGVVKNVSLSMIFKGCLWFVFFSIVTLLILFFFPDISLWLPSKTQMTM